MSTEHLPSPRPASISSTPLRRSSLPGGDHTPYPTTSRDDSDMSHRPSGANLHRHSQHQPSMPQLQFHDKNNGIDIEKEAAHGRRKGEDSDDDAAAPPPPATGVPRLGQEGFWSPRLKAHRTAYFKGILMVTVAVSIMVWSMLSLYWGSLWKQYDFSPNLVGWIVNRDGDTVGNFLETAMLQANNGAKPHVTWKVIDPSLYPTVGDLDYQVANELSTYIAMTVFANSTQRLLAAQAAGDASWDPSSVVSLTYASARNAQVVSSIVLAPAQHSLGDAINRLAVQLAASFFSNPPANVAALVARAPQTVVAPIAVLNRGVRHYDHPVAIAVLLVGLIYLTILCFNITMAHFGARQPLQPFLRLRSLIMMRMLVPLVAYAWVALMVTILNVPFKLPYGQTFSYGAGFMVWWCATFVGMAVLGLSTETMLSLVGTQFIGFGMAFLIIVQVSVANIDIPLSPSFYRYGYAMPVYNIRAIYNTVIYDVGKHADLGKYFGILFAWLVVIFLTFPIWIWLERRRSLKAREEQRRKGGVVGPPPAKPPMLPRA